MAELAPSCPGNLRNPKRGRESRRGRPGWYDYYAGFSPDFVQDALNASGAEPGVARVLDPWNGSGTTTDVSSRNGFNAIGFDLNPVMVIVAKARALHPNVHPSIPSLLEEILLRAGAIDAEFDQDPLTAWLSVDTASYFRKIEIALRLVLINANKQLCRSALQHLQSVSPLAAFFYVALFRSLKRVVKPFRSSNPTWIKGACTTADRLHVPPYELNTLLRIQVANMCEDLILESSRLHSDGFADAQIGMATSSALPLKASSVQVVITSPPYCTRIDYVIKTGPELALLGMCDPAEVRRLRDSMIGTPTIVKEIPQPREDWGPACLNLLAKVSCHKSRASKSYYLKTQLQYFDSLFNSLVEINRTLTDSGECFFVVQDSYYKEIHVDLALIIQEMGTSIGWSHGLRRDFVSRRTMVGVNNLARIYNNPRVAVESVMHFSKKGGLGG